MPSRALSSLFLLLILFGCAAAGTDPGVRRDPNLITGEEIRASGHTNAMDAIRSLRGQWLRERPPATFGPPDVIIVYVDNTKWGEVSTLGQVPTSGVNAIRRLNAVDATQRWGPGHAAGVIWIQTVGA